MAHGTGESDGTGQPVPRPLPASARHPLWWLLSAVFVTAAAVAAVNRRHDIASALRLMGAVPPAWLVLGALLEVLSLTCMAAMQWWLLKLGGARLGFPLMGAMVAAANAVAGALPGGAAFAAAWLFGQLRRRHVSLVLAGSVLAVSGLLSALALFFLLVVGVLTGSGSGPGAGLRSAVLWLTVALVLAATAVVALSRFPSLRRRAWRLWRKIGVRTPRMWDIEEGLSRLVRHVRVSRPGVRPWLAPFALAVSNWILDVACLIACAWGLGIALPWPGTLIAYTLTQMTGALRLTPGSLGVIETSLAALLVLYGLPADQAIALTLLYRIASYWVLQPIGWVSWLLLTVASRHGAVTLRRRPKV
ncbi:lysylphosphatidylglycerol synthase transmembrane domain-containing protein [Streptomyces sp. NBC_01294]|uniref:lysylphosphatidylglycerol synthase transmembrane domain-containing protein n=1 Tax=Streptomyces sp. NBC_01294 TaxID=2903815 RepID=UPI002DD85593|nr:YbhN family protein [Streptomyces sp. NBC_01294]WRZ61108.1 YbhN family protein [Streptomyces sp. NBC_01294]